jgi:hypothetical protein
MFKLTNPYPTPKKEAMNLLKIARGGILVAIALFLMPFVAHADETASATAQQAISVNTYEGELRTVLPKDIYYSPSWCGEVEQGAYVVIEKVEHAGMFNAVTSTVTTCAADAELSFNYSADEGEPCVRFIHRVYSSEGQEIGTTLVRDVSFGVSSSPSVAVFADSRTNSLQEVVAAGRVDNLAYSTAWATNAASVTISAVMLSGKGGTPASTNSFFMAVADAEGRTSMRGVGMGFMRLLYIVEDASGETLLEYQTDEFKKKGGFFLIVR